MNAQTDPVAYGAELRRRRKAHGLSQTALAEQAGVSRGSVSNAENGTTSIRHVRRSIEDVLAQHERGEVPAEPIRRISAAAEVTARTAALELAVKTSANSAIWTPEGETCDAAGTEILALAERYRAFIAGETTTPTGTRKDRP